MQKTREKNGSCFRFEELEDGDNLWTYAWQLSMNPQQPDFFHNTLTHAGLLDGWCRHAPETVHWKQAAKG